MTPESIMLLNIPMKEHYIETEEELDLLLQERLQHTLSLISGSRYLFSRFLEFVNVSEELVHRLDKCSQIAKRMKNAFTKAAISNKINREKLSQLCDELKHMEIECF